MSSELPKQYRPAEHEDRIFDRWTASRAFHADPAAVLSGEREPYCIVSPPPNVTAALHLGHALNNTIQDILARAHRMMGYETLWMPGTDHAGIATQAVVEKRVMKEEKKRRTDFTREQFIAKIQAFKDEYEATITNQLKKMGCSCDWDRQRFTMDPICARAVREAFFRLFKDGLIYRGKRLVNWDPALQTAIADDEIENIEIDGNFYYLRYPLVHPTGARTIQESSHNQPAPDDAVPVTWGELARRGYPGAEKQDADGEAFVTVATTRPETYLGDTAVAVNPKDPRAKALRGLSVELPLVGRVIPVIEDDYVVMPSAKGPYGAALNLKETDEPEDPKAAFATGFLKVTPAHDPNDYELGRKHNLPMINIMAPDASISDKHGWTDIGDAHLFVGKKREEARKLVVKEFEARGLLEKVQPYRHTVGHSDRSKAAIEPYLSDQWYVRVTDPRMAQAANAALVPEQRKPTPGLSESSSEGPGQDANHVRFHPARYAKTYETWHDNIRDWCISRQLWWGHRIPVWSFQARAGTAGELETAVAVFVDCYADDEKAAVIRDGELVRLSTANEHLTAALTALEAHLSQQSANSPADRILQVKNLDLDWLSERIASCSRDPDVLDTWFSSALWPMSTMAWPDDTDLLRAFNPTSTLCTAREIITLWVSRMVMFNRYFRGQDLGAGAGSGPVPYRDVFIHSVIQDGEGRKMSKTLGNGVDPLDIIATHGADAMRFTLCHMTTQTQDVRLPVVKDSATGKNTSPKFDLGRNLANKLWNAARFALGILSADSPTPPLLHSSTPPPLSLVDRWMLSRLSVAVAACNTALKEFQFADYATTAYDLLWRDFCDWYLEAIKPTVASDPNQRAVLAATLDTILRLLHPVMPYVTEAIYEAMREQSRTITTDPVRGVDLGPARKDNLLATAGWPKVDPALRDESAEREFEELRAFITAIREVRAQHNVQPKRRITLHAPAGTPSLRDASNVTLVKTLAGVETITQEPPAGPSVAFNLGKAEFKVSDLADAATMDTGAERSRLEKLVADLDKSIGTFEGRLANPGYAQKAPPHMVQQTKDQLEKARAERSAAAATLASLG
jgi:valyl-tRNA synthetase